MRRTSPLFFFRLSHQEKKPKTRDLFLSSDTRIWRDEPRQKALPTRFFLPPGKTGIMSEVPIFSESKLMVHGFKKMLASVLWRVFTLGKNTRPSAGGKLTNHVFFVLGLRFTTQSRLLKKHQP